MMQQSKSGVAGAMTPPEHNADATGLENERFAGDEVDPEVLALLNEGIDGEDSADGDKEDEEDEEEDEFAGAGLTAEAKVHLMAEAADAVKAEEIVALDVRALTIIADYFLICTGKSSIQIRAISDRIEEKLRNAGERKLRVEGRQEATWILMDYGDVLVHIMAAEQRAFYRLEDLWSEAPRVELDLLPA
jgi:ribosome-associated protein